MKKEKWINIYKAILIILMVIGHTYTIFGKIIYNFHIACFFMISGYCFSNKNENFISYFKRKFNRLMVPFFINTLILTIISIILSNSTIFYQEKINSNILYIFLRYFNVVDLAGALWFLPILFFTQILYKLIIDVLNTTSVKESKKGFTMTIISMIVFIWGYTYFTTGEIISYNFDLVMASLVFYSLGYNFKQIEKYISQKIIFILFIFSVIILYVFNTKFYQFINWPTRTFPNIFTFLIVSISGFIVLYFISKKVSNLKFKFKGLCYIGDHTQAILSFHFLGFRFLFTILYLFHIVGIEQTQSLTPLYNNTIYGVLTAIFGILFSLVFEYVLIKITKFDILKINKHINIYLIFGLIVLTSLFNLWIFDSRNFFTFDDFSHLKVVSSTSFSNLFTILPNSAYNSRPVGQLVMKLLVELFNYNFIYHAISLLLIHIINVVLVYILSIKLFKFNNVQSFIIALVFGNFPTSIMAFTWEAAMFDLVGCTITLLCFLVFYKIRNNKNIIYNILLIVLYYLGLRTKEMLIALPCILFVYTIYIDFIKEKKSLNYYIKKNISILIMLIIMLLYFMYIRVLNGNSDVTNDINGPYYYSYSIFSMIYNIIKYLYMYFNVFSMSLTYNSANKYILVFIALIFILLIVYSLYLLYKNKPKLIFIGICFIGLLLPVLPMKNTQHILYLYIPSIFIVILIVELLNKLNFNMKSIFITLFILVLANNFSSVSGFRNWWLTITNQDKQTYQYLLSIKENYHDIQKVHVINVDTGSYYSYYYGPGAIVNVAFENYSIITDINSEYIDDDSLIIDCLNDCKVIE